MSFSVSNTSVTNEPNVYILSGTESYNNFQTGIAKFVLAAALVTSASTLLVPPFSQNSAVSYNLESTQARGKRKKSSEAIIDFAMELQKRSISLGENDAKLWRQIIVAQSQPGFPEF